MWTFMLTGLATGTRIILYDGSPFHPDLRTYLKFINDQRYIIIYCKHSLITNNSSSGFRYLEQAHDSWQKFRAKESTPVSGALFALYVLIQFSPIGPVRGPQNTVCHWCRLDQSHVRLGPAGVR